MMRATSKKSQPCVDHLSTDIRRVNGCTSRHCQKVHGLFLSEHTKNSFRNFLSSCLRRRVYYDHHILDAVDSCMSRQLWLFHTNTHCLPSSDMFGSDRRTKMNLFQSLSKKQVFGANTPSYSILL